MIQMRLGQSARGAILFEAILATSVFVVSGLAILAMLDQAVSRMTAIQQAEEAVDLARSAMAKIEASLATPESLNGPVDPMEDQAMDSGSIGPPMLSGQDARWELFIDTEPSSFPGLTLVSVRAVRLDNAGNPDESIAYELRQLVKLFEDDSSHFIEAGPGLSSTAFEHAAGGLP